MTKHVVKLRLKSNCDKNQIVKKNQKKNQCDKTQIVTKLENSNNSKTRKLKLGQNMQYGKSQLMKKNNLKRSFSRNIFTP